MNNKLLTEHPGRILLEEFPRAPGISVWHLAKDLGVSVRRIYEYCPGTASYHSPTSRIA